MRSQWHSHESWGTMGFVPLTMVSLLCFFLTCSCPKPAVPAAVPPFLSLPCLAIGMAWMHTAVVQPLFPHALKNPLPGPGNQHHQNAFFSLWLQRKFPTAGSVLHTRHSAGSCLNGAQLENSPWCNLRVQWVRKWASTHRDPSPAGHSLSVTPSAPPALLHCSSCLALGSWVCCLCHPSPVPASNQSPWWYTDLTFQLCSIRISCRWLSGESADKTKQKLPPDLSRSQIFESCPWTLDQISA